MSISPENTTPENTAPKRSRISSAAVVFTTFLIGAAFGALNSSSVLAVVKTYDDLEVFADVLNLVETNYVDPVTSNKLIEGSINGMLRTLDPHSSYMTPETYKEMQAETEGEFGGIGIEITTENGVLTVVAPMEETPAWRAGVKAGDKIVKVNGESTYEMNLMDAVRKMRGKRGTSVNITIMRDGWEDPKDYTLVRDVIKVASVKSQLLPDNWGYLRIRNFSKDTSQETSKALVEMKKQGMKGLVLDLRNDPGGLLNQAVEVTDLFVNKGDLIVYTKSRMKNQDMRFSAQKGSSEAAYPLVVLVNHGSASASEIVAGALQDLKRAILVGNQTFGKGSVQTIIPLKGDAGLRLTTARYYTPSGRQIQGVGIAPDIIVEQPDDEKQAQTSETKKDKDKDKEKEKDKRKAISEKDLPHALDVDKSKEKDKHTVPAVPPAKPGDDKDKESQDKSKPTLETNGKRPLVDLEKDVQLQRAVSVLKSWEIIGSMGGAQKAAPSNPSSPAAK
jgi:carboxyl-terminal processing protease